MIPLRTVNIPRFQSEKGEVLSEIAVSYVDSDPLSDKPVVMVIHALTGNAYSFGQNGWWSSLIGEDQTIDLRRYRVVSFNIPGNGYTGSNGESRPYDRLKPRDVARLFDAGRKLLGIEEVHALIGGSLGGGIIWEWAYLLEDRLRYLIPIACSWQSSDWVMGQTYVQDRILNTSGLEAARMAAMTIYRSPQSFKNKFERSNHEDKGIPNVESWLDHHGKKLAGRFSLQAYRSMNYMLGRLDLFENRYVSDVRKTIRCQVVQIGISSDLLFSSKEMLEIHFTLTKWGVPNHFYLINSPHGHDAFLIEYEQLDSLLTPYFPKTENQKPLPNRKKIETCAL